MSLCVLRVGVRLHPEKGAFRVHGLGAEPFSMQAPPMPGGALVSVGYDQMWIGSLQDDVEITVLLEEWDDEPPAAGGPWEEEAQDELYLRGAVAISTALSEPVVHGVRLRGGVCRYNIRIRTRHRAQIAHLYDQLLDRMRNTFDEQFQEALRQLQGVEHYLIQLWPSRSISATGPMRAVGLEPLSQPDDSDRAGI